GRGRLGARKRCRGRRFAAHSLAVALAPSRDSSGFLPIVAPAFGGGGAAGGSSRTPRPERGGAGLSVEEPHVPFGRVCHWRGAGWPHRRLPAHQERRR